MILTGWFLGSGSLGGPSCLLHLQHFWSFLPVDSSRPLVDLILGSVPSQSLGQGPSRSAKACAAVAYSPSSRRTRVSTGSPACKALEPRQAMAGGLCEVLQRLVALAFAKGLARAQIHALARRTGQLQPTVDDPNRVFTFE